MSKKVLVLLSSATQVPLKEGGSHETGIFLGELVEPLLPLIEAGHVIEFVSPDGKPASVDVNSYKLMYWGFSNKKLEEGKKTLHRLKEAGMDQPMVLSELLKDEVRLAGYDLLFVPGGHAPMTDLLHENWLQSDVFNQNVGILLNKFHDNQKLTAMICHAPAVLASARNSQGQSTYDGYEVTCVTGVSEWITEEVPFFKAVDGHLKAYPEDILKSAGMVLKQNPIPMLSHVVEDRRLITGQDPYAAQKLGKVLMRKLSAEVK